MTGAGRSGGGRPGRQDSGHSRIVGAKIGSEMGARVRGWSGHALRRAGSGSGRSCSSLPLLPSVVPLPPRAFPNDGLRWLGGESRSV